jgi:prepilin-type processing-associated H-X9-DG protein
LLAGNIPPPQTLASIQYPADQVTFYEGYLTGSGNILIAVGRHAANCNVAYSDGHSKSFHMQLNPNTPDIDSYTMKPYDQWLITQGPYRNDPGKLQAAFVGVVTDPTCPSSDTQPSTQCRIKCP